MIDTNIKILSTIIIRVVLYSILPIYILIGIESQACVVADVNSQELTPFSIKIVKQYLRDETKIYKLRKKEHCIRIDFEQLSTGDSLVRFYNYDLEETSREYIFIGYIEGFSIYYKGKQHPLFFREASVCIRNKDSINIEKVKRDVVISNRAADILDLSNTSIGVDFDPALIYSFEIRKNKIIDHTPGYLQKLLSR